MISPLKAQAADGHLEENVQSKATTHDRQSCLPYTNRSKTKQQSMARLCMRIVVRFWLSTILARLHRRDSSFPRLGRHQDHKIAARLVWAQLLTKSEASEGKIITLIGCVPQSYRMALPRAPSFPKHPGLILCNTLKLASLNIQL